MYVILMSAKLTDKRLPPGGSQAFGVTDKVIRPIL